MAKYPEEWFSYTGVAGELRTPVITLKCSHNPKGTEYFIWFENHDFYVSAHNESRNEPNAYLKSPSVPQLRLVAPKSIEGQQLSRLTQVLINGSVFVQHVESSLPNCRPKKPEMIITTDLDIAYGSLQDWWFPFYLDTFDPAVGRINFQEEVKYHVRDTFENKRGILSVWGTPMHTSTIDPEVLRTFETVDSDPMIKNLCVRIGQDAQGTSVLVMSLIKART